VKIFQSVRRQIHYNYDVTDKNNNVSPNKETDIINMLEFLIDNIFVIFAGRVFQLTVGIPIGTNCAADLSVSVVSFISSSIG
jgi:hypothetical protein